MNIPPPPYPLKKGWFQEKTKLVELPELEGMIKDERGNGHSANCVYSLVDIILGLFIACAAHDWCC